MDLSSIPTSNLVNAVMDVLFKTQDVTPSRRDFELLDKGWMGGVDGVLFFNGVTELKRRLDHMPISDLIVRERDDARRERAAAASKPPESTLIGGAQILSNGKDW